MARRTDEALSPAILDAARAALAVGHDPSADSTIREALEATRPPLPVVAVRPSASPARRHLACAVAAARAGPAALAERLFAAAPGLDWHYGYAQRLDLARDVAFANIVGPRGPFVCPTVRIGLTLIGPHVAYPAHSHPAAELYVVLAGIAEWSLGNAAARRHPPGAAIVHPPRLIHTMRTADDPLLAMFVWTGAIDSPATYAFDGQQSRQATGQLGGGSIT